MSYIRKSRVHIKSKVAWHRKDWKTCVRSLERIIIRALHNELSFINSTQHFTALSTCSFWRERKNLPRWFDLSLNLWKVEKCERSIIGDNLVMLKHIQRLDNELIVSNIRSVSLRYLLFIVFKCLLLVNYGAGITITSPCYAWLGLQ